MLIINNVRKPVNTNQEPYESVVAAWTSGMDTMERLVCGTPQRVQDGAILVAITAWHLYPNMQVLSDRAKDINPGDKLMVRSLLTISTFDISGGREGVFWSLPLSRMRYYSPPVVTERSLASDTSRISIEEFQIVFLGAFVAPWSRICSDEERCCRLVIQLHNAYQRLDTVVPSWFKILADAASRLVNSSGPSQAQNRKLLRLGSRRCSAFLHDPEYDPPAMFGLEYFHVLIRCLTDVKERIKLLRDGTQRHSKARKPKLVLRYKKQSPHVGTGHQYATVFPSTRTSHKRSLEQEARSSTGHERFAIGHFQENKSTVMCHGLVGCGCTDAVLGECICRQHNTACTFECHEDMEMCNNAPTPYPPVSFDCQKDCSSEQPCVGCLNKSLQRVIADEGEEAFLIHPKYLENVDPFQFILQMPGETVSRTYGLWLGHGQIAAVFQQQESTTYDTYSKSVSDMPSATMEEIEAVIASSAFDPTSLELWSCCYHWSGEGFQQQMRSLNALVFASNLYKSMPDSTVSIEVINSAMYNTSWASSIEPEDIPTCDLFGIWWHNDETVDGPSSRTNVLLDSHWYMPYTSDQASDLSVDDYNEDLLSEDDLRLTVVPEHPRAGDIENRINEGTERQWPNLRQETDGIGEAVRQNSDRGQHNNGLQMRRAFSCIAWFDSGEFDIPLENLHAVMALANGASIYVASGLLVDPSASTADTPIRRVFGNLGRSELCLLVPPADPRLAKPDVRSWKLINHLAFDGQFQDCFGGTSLHLTFTESEEAVYVGNRGLRDRQVVLLEALISIDDRGRNIGDLDILSMFTKSSLHVNDSCAHPSDKAIGTVSDWDLTAVDCWEEFLDPPNGTAIFRARGNWEARLGATAAAIQIGKKVLVLPQTACLHCLAKSVKKRIDIIIA
jgi:hypothetical protein